MAYSVLAIIFGSFSLGLVTAISLSPCYHETSRDSYKRVQTKSLKVFGQQSGGSNRSSSAGIIVLSGLP